MCFYMYLNFLHYKFLPVIRRNSQSFEFAMRSTSRADFSRDCLPNPELNNGALN